jgi:hypothetical protein
MLRQSSGAKSSISRSAGSFFSRHSPAIKAGAATVALSVATAAAMRIGENMSNHVVGGIDKVMRVPQEQRSPDNGFHQALSMQQMGMSLGGMGGYNGMSGYNGMARYNGIARAY